MKKKGQVWIETVIYTLIAFVMIGLVLAFARPKISEIQDNVIISQSIKMIEDIDSTILNIQSGGQGNKRILEIGIKKGTLKIDGGNDKIIFEVETGQAYSEPGNEIEEGNLNILTQTHGSAYNVTITRDYSTSHDIHYQGQNEVGIISKAPSPYKISITNEGTVTEETEIKTEINFEVI